LVKENTGARKVVNEDKEFAKGDRVNIGGKEYANHEPTPEDLRKHVFDMSIIESDPLQWLKQANIVFEWSKLFRNDDNRKYAFIIILCAAMTTKHIQELFKDEVDVGRIDAIKVSPKWADVFLLIISLYLDVLNVSDEWGEDLLKVVGQPFFFASPESNKEINNIINDWQIRRRKYATSQGHTEEIMKLLGTTNLLFGELIITHALENINQHDSFYEADLKGKSVDLEKLIEMSISGSL